MEFAQACKGLGLRPIHGAELTIDGVGHLTLLVESRRRLAQPLPAADRGARRQTPGRGPDR